MELLTLSHPFRRLEQALLKRIPAKSASMILLIALAQAATPAQDTQPRVQARAVGRVVRPVVATREEWEHLAPASRREIIRNDEFGRPVIIRLIEHE